MKRGKKSSTVNYSWSRTRGQVTIFVILGIVMLVVIIFALFVSSTLAKIKLQSQANKAVDAYLASESVNYYVYTCMDSAVTSAIDDLALQGGVFFDYEDGPYKVTDVDVGQTYIPFNISYANTSGGTSTKYLNVSYSIINNSYCNIVNTTVPDYPYADTYISQLYGLYNNKQKNNNCLTNYKEGYVLSGFAGMNNMTRLCRLGGNNTKSISNIEFSPCYNSVIKDANRSVEYLLEQQISMRMKKCADFSVFVDDNITVLNDPVTTLTYTSDSLFAETTYNLSVRIQNKEPVVVKHAFSYQSNLRIVRLHNYVMSLLKADSQDFFFSIKNNYESYSANSDLDPGVFFDRDYMTVHVINFTDCNPAVTPGCDKYKYDHIIIVEDKKSKIGNNSLTYITAVKNRVPALEFMHETIPSSEYDIVASDSQEIKLTPMGYDPDDRNVTYRYEGWKETWDDRCTIIPNPNPNPNAFSQFNCVKINSVPALYPKNWSNSVLFTRTKKDANYTTNKSDMGPHVVRVTTIDESGLYDYQDVKILVFDLPKAIISPIKVYSDTPENMTSIEDKFILNSSLSTASVVGGGQITAYVWTINRIISGVPVEVFTNRTSGTILNIPTESYNIPDDNKLIQQIKPLNLSNKGLHNVTLVVESTVPLVGSLIYSPPDAVSLDVTECLSHESATNDLPFPYNTGNPFFANHACCSGSNTYESASTVCYQTNRYGYYRDLIDGSLAYTLSNNVRFTDYTNGFTDYSAAVNSPTQLPANANVNDIYVLSFERFCDGSRGNICAGNMKRTVTSSLPCPDKQANEQETCSGPSQLISTTPVASCTKYASGQSFETTFGILLSNGQPATGICNTAFACSSIGVNGYGDGGKHYCQATCSGGTCKNTLPSDCTCNKPICSATCTSVNDFERTGDNCKYSCNLNSCAYTGNRVLPCTGDNCYSNTPGFTGYCYFNVKCAAIPPFYDQGDFCRPGLDPADGNLCIFDSTPLTITDRCGTGANVGKCILGKSSKVGATCSDDSDPACDAATGWVCLTGTLVYV